MPQLTFSRCVLLMDMDLARPCPLHLNIPQTKVRFMAVMFYQDTSPVLSAKMSSIKEFLHLDMAIPAKYLG